MQSNRSKSTEAKQAHQSNEEKHPQFFFRGIWTPPAVLFAISEGKINQTEYVLLGMIDSLTNPDGTGCYASNRYLGDYLKVRGDYISRCLSNLAALGFIRIEQNKNSRFIWVAWAFDRPVDPRTGSPRGVGLAVLPKVITTLLHNKKHNPLDRRKRRIEGVAEPTTNGKAQTLSPTPAKIKETDRTTDDYKWAAKLHDAVAGKAGICRKWSHIGWANEFMRLRNAAPLERIGRALDWYCIHIGGKYIPQIWSAKKFRLEFHRVEAAVKRDTGEDPDIKISTRAKGIVEELTARLDWPKGSAKLLPQAVQVSLNNWRDFIISCKLATDQPGKYGRTRLAEYIVDKHPDVNFFVTGWFKDLNKRVQTWNEWSGRIMDQVISKDHKELTKMGRRWSQLACGNGSGWDKLVEAIYGSGKKGQS